MHIPLHQIIDGKKQCTKCNQSLSIDRFGTFKNRYGKVYYKGECKNCCTKKSNNHKKEFTKKHPEIVSARRKEYYNRYFSIECNLQKRKDQCKLKRDNNIEEYRKLCNNTRIKVTTLLTDGYVKAVICRYGGLRHSDIPQNVVELKREQLLIKRKLKSHGKES